jgi:hypothetical protein
MRHRAYWESRRPDCSRLSFIADERSVGRAHLIFRRDRQHNGPPEIGSRYFDGLAFTSPSDDNNGSTHCTGKKVPPPPFLDANGAVAMLVNPKNFRLRRLANSKKLATNENCRYTASYRGFDDSSGTRDIPHPTLFAAKPNRRPIFI